MVAMRALGGAVAGTLVLLGLLSCVQLTRPSLTVLLRHSRLAAVPESRQNVLGSLAALDHPVLDGKTNNEPLRSAGVKVGNDGADVRTPNTPGWNKNWDGDCPLSPQTSHAEKVGCHVVTGWDLLSDLGLLTKDRDLTYCWLTGAEDNSDDVKLERHGVRVKGGFLRKILPYPGLQENVPMVGHPRSHEGLSAMPLKHAGVYVGDSRDIPGVHDNLREVHRGLYAYIDGPAGIQRTRTYWSGDAASNRALERRGVTVESKSRDWRALPLPQGQATPPLHARELPRTRDQSEDSARDWLDTF